MVKFKRPPSVRAAAYELLRASILEGSLGAGERISEPRLASRLGVSRTPVREALQRLSQEGLVELSPHRGARVRSFTREEVRQLYEVRALLEGEAARLAARGATEKELGDLARRLDELDRVPASRHAEQMRVDFDFHAALVAAGHNPVLSRLYGELRAGLAMVRASVRTRSQHPETRRQHHAILRALRRRDPAAAEAAVRAHVFRFRDLVAGRLPGDA